MLPYIVIFIIKHIITLISIIESVNKYLVHNCTLCPLWCLKSWCDLKIIIFVKILNCSNLVVKTHCPAKLNAEIIIHFLCSNINLSLIIIKHTLASDSCHNMLDIINNKICFIYIISSSTQPYGHLITWHWLCRTSVITCNIRKQRSWV